MVGGRRFFLFFDVGVDDSRQRVALLGEAPDVVAQGLTGLLLAALEVPRVARPHIRALKVADEDLVEICPTADGVGGQEVQPGADVFSQAYREILDDEVFVGRSSGSACKPVIHQPHAGVCIPSILHDVRWWSEALGERCPPDCSGEGIWSGGIRTWTLVVIQVGVAGMSSVAER